MPFKNENEIKTFLFRENLRELVFGRPALQKTNKQKAKNKLFRLKEMKPDGSLDV